MHAAAPILRRKKMKKKKKKKTNKTEKNTKKKKKHQRLGVETERSGVPHRESKPSAHRHRTARIARTTRQINGAMDFCG